MSKLKVSSPQGGIWELNVTSFSSPMYGTIGSAQTKMTWQHFPIKVAQPQLQLQVIFRSIDEFILFQTFVRAHQLNALVSADLLTLNWPQRNINQWTGVVRGFRAGMDRFTYAPMASFEIDLVDSMASQRTELATMVDSDMYYWTSVVGVGSPDGMLAPPTPMEWRVATGQDQPGRNTIRAH